MNNINSSFYTSSNWLSGFTGKLDITNLGENLDGWTIEFEAAFEITKVLAFTTTIVCTFF